MEMVDSVDDFKSSSSVRGIQMLNFEVVDTRIASALNRIIHNSHFKRRISLEEQKAQIEDRFLRGRQIASGSWSHSAPTCSRLVFEMTIFRNSIQSGTGYYYQ